MGVSDIGAPFLSVQIINSFSMVFFCFVYTCLLKKWTEICYTILDNDQCGLNAADPERNVKSR